MKSLAELDQLNLDPTVKSQLAAMIQSLLDQAKRDVNAQLQAKDVELQNTQAELQAKTDEIKRKDFKIESLTFE